MIQIRRILMDDALYAQECALREAVLLGPIGFDLDRFRREFPGIEERMEHYVAVFDHPSGPRVVGSVGLVVDHPAKGVGKLTQMCVDPQRQGEGIGKRLVVAVERRAFGELELAELFCHAQIAACGFYRRLAWNPDGEVFTEAGIEHRKMILRPSLGEPAEA
ncbi:MAG: GNAT family N-acetyltransferase [Phycisphaeraceae bacterium]|nr:GNAT family N-acetyltransferase [Phycisphaeraceae bacterium]